MLLVLAVAEEQIRKHQAWASPPVIELGEIMKKKDQKRTGTISGATSDVGSWANESKVSNTVATHFGSSDSTFLSLVRFSIFLFCNVRDKRSNNSGTTSLSATIFLAVVSSMSNNVRVWVKCTRAAEGLKNS